MARADEEFDPYNFINMNHDEIASISDTEGVMCRREYLPDVETKVAAKMYKGKTRSEYKENKYLRESNFLFVDNTMQDEVSEEDEAWLASLSDSELELLVSIKQMAMERAKTVDDKSIKGIFSFRVLRAMGLLLKELAMERAKADGISSKSDESEDRNKRLKQIIKHKNGFNATENRTNN